MSKRIAIFIILLTFALVGCSSAPNYSAPMQPGTDMVLDYAKYEEAPRDSTTTGTAGDASRIVIRNADVSLIVDQPDVAVEEITRMAEAAGGYVVNSNTYQVTLQGGLTTPQANIAVRVPADKLNDFIEKIKALVNDQENDIKRLQITGKDITMEYTDLQSRLKNLETTRDQLMKFMDDASNTEEVMLVYEKLVSINEQIEVLKGQIKYYDESVQLSAISISLESTKSAQPITIGGWKPAGVAKDAVQLLITLGKGLVNFLIYFVIVLVPLGIVIYLVVRLIIWLVRKLIKIKPRAKKTPVDQGKIPPAQQ